MPKEHYSSATLLARIEQALDQAGKDREHLTIKDIAPMDQMHSCGIPATLNLLEKANIPSNARILDTGCGLGGSCRAIANNNKDCTITGLDLSESLIEAATVLTRYTKLDKTISYKTGSILDLPFEANRFDMVLCQHVLVNISDTQKALSECYRVLAPGGQLVLHEITKGPGPDLLMPVPWADRSEISCIKPWDTYATTISDLGFVQEYSKDQTQMASTWWQKIHENKQKNQGKVFPISAALVFGKNADEFSRTMSENFSNKAVCLMESIYRKN